MKCLSIRQPWASLILSGWKKYEFRTWRPHGDPALDLPLRIALHASARRPTRRDLEFLQAEINRCFVLVSARPLGVYEESLLGHVFALADLVAAWDPYHPLCPHPKEIRSTPGFDPTAFRLYAWELANVVRLKRPVPVRGRLGLFEVDLGGVM